MKAVLALVLAIGVTFALLGTTPAFPNLYRGSAEANSDFHSQPANRFSSSIGAQFDISDEDGIPFWTTYRWLGGARVLGYPISGRFTWDGLICQATEYAVLQWNPTEGRVVLANTLDYLSAIGKDEWLQGEHLVPGGLDQGPERGLTRAQVRQRRLSLLDTCPKLKSVYMASPDPVRLHGLPTSAVTDMGPALVLRTQRSVLYHWQSTTSSTRAGEVTIGRAGEMFRAAGLIPEPALGPVLETRVDDGRASLSSRGSQRDVEAVAGVSTWYGNYFHGRTMFNGERYDMYDPTTTASNIFPMGTLLKVTCVDTGHYVIVRVTDRGAFRHPIVVDLSYAAFRLLANPNKGVIKVQVEPVI